MQRLVYSPKAYIFIKNRDGVIGDYSRYCTAGSITRRINQVSSASLTLRNPNMIFTKTSGHGAAFGSMDPITIYLERLPGHRVRVFTGYLDEVPFIELFPGTVTIEASCTLKKLQYTFFDPALPYTTSFLSKYGWVNKDGLVFNPVAVTQQLTDNVQEILKQNKYSGAELNDGSMGQLLWATLYHIGNWPDSNIYIEKLPAGIIQRVTNLYHQFDEADKQAKKEFEHLLAAIIGDGGYGSSSGNVSLQGINGSVPTKVYEVGKRMNVPSKLMLAAFETGLTETTNFSNPATGDGTSVGWRQETASAYPGVNRMDVAASAQRFFNEGLAIMSGSTQGKAGTGFYQPSWTAGNLAQAIQGSAFPDRYDNNRAAARTLLQRISQQVDKGNTHDPKKVPNNSGSSSDKTAPASRKGGKNDMSQYSPPFPPGTKWNSGRVDQGWDLENMPIGTPVLSMTDGEVVDVLNNEINGNPHDGHGFGPNYPIIKVTGGGPLAGQTIYYGHVDPCSVKKVDKVFAGDEIAKIQDINGNGGHIEIGFWPLGSMTDGAYIKPYIQAIFDHGKAPPRIHGTNPSSGGGGGGNSSDMASQATAAALAGTLQFPTALERIEAVFLQGQKSLMNDKPLLPFIQQMADASLRSFQSMPNGDFFGFYPDYFGEFGRKDPYWLIDDIEVLDGRVKLSDAATATHVYVVGDTTGNAFGAGSEMINTLFSAGVVTVFNAFEAGIENAFPFLTGSTNAPGNVTALEKRAQAVEFIKKYGARPLVQDQPMIRSPFFEMFSAYQTFMLAWSRQYLTPFTFTFMPELYPGGKVGFPDHGIQMYIDEVSHTWDYESGFFTQANLMAPQPLTNQEAKNAG